MDIEYRLEPGARRVRARFGGVVVADSARAMMMMGGYEPPRYELPNYYFPREHVRTDLLEPSEKTTVCETRGRATHWSLAVGDRTAVDDVWSYEDPPAEWSTLAGLVAFTWSAMDAWYEEDEEVFVHARSPYHRVDVLRSSRHVRVALGGETLADSRRPCLLLETSMPPRYYLPRDDVRLELLAPSPTRTQCPYKGIAHYFSAEIGGRTVEDIAWSYVFPVPECPKIEQLVCFFNERVDIEVDGEAQAHPATRWEQGLAPGDTVTGD